MQVYIVTFLVRLTIANAQPSNLSQTPTHIKWAHVAHFFLNYVQFIINWFAYGQLVETNLFHKFVAIFRIL